MKYRILLGSMLLASLFLYFYTSESNQISQVGSFKIKQPLLMEEDCKETPIKKYIPKVIPKTKRPISITYKADIAQGVIGISDSLQVDHAYDNIFHVQIDQLPSSKDAIWLTYDLEGVADHTSIARSINDRISIGGYLVNKHDSWTGQRESIPNDWLKLGDNVVRFSVPSKINSSCKIKNLGIQIIRDSKEKKNKRSVVLNIPNPVYFNNKAYLKGYLEGKEKNKAQLFIGTQKIDNIDGEFEYILTKDKYIGSNWPIEIVAIYPDGKEISHQITLNHQDKNPDFLTKITQKEKVAQSIVSPEKVSVVVADGLKLIIPVGAISQPEVIKIQPLQNRDLPPLPVDMVNVTPKNGGFRLLPDGSIFSKPINLEIDYDPQLIPAGYTAADIRTYYFDEQKRKWTQISKKALCDTGNCINSLTDHFTDFINGIIKVPESPETNGYTPTSIKDLKAANPSANIQQMETPKPNNQGNLNSRMSIKIPAGRNGMQPQIALSYNNEGGNGWLGLGWDYSTPAISIETRWGVPRYDKVLETETYLLNGDQLTPLSHRNEFVPRYQRDQIFHRRVEGSFERIIRHGDTPKNYWWEVTDKNGTVNYYGGLPEIDDVIDDAVLKTADDNIAHWCLVMTKDANGNTVRYYYDTVDHYGITDATNLGQQLYIDRITYTGYEEEDGKYEVHFTRDSELNDSKRFNRPDVNINCRLGFKQVTADLLRHIEVNFDGDLVRRYELEYQEGAFFKTLLTACREYDRKDSLFTEQEFIYFDEVRDDSKNYQPYSARKDWKVDRDGIHTNDSDTIRNFSNKVTLFGSGSSSNETFGGSVTVGLGCMPGKLLSVGGNYSRAKSDGSGLVTLTDIDGDKLPDKVFSIGEHLYYRKNLSNPENFLTEYSDTIRIFGEINQFSESSTKSTSKGVEANPLVAFVGKSKSKATTKTNTYFIDANNDQLIDICKDGIVYFNHINKDGNIEFSKESNLTPNPISMEGSINEDIMDIELIDEDSLIDENPLIDMVKVWYAQEEGLININAPFQLIINAASIEYGKTDGVKISIQKNEELLDSMTIIGNDADTHNLNIPNLIPVEPQDRIFFRVQSRFDGAYDQINWSPTITYNEASIPDSVAIDINGKSRKEYQSTDDYLLASCQATTLAFSGELTIESDFFKPKTTDTLIAMVKLDNAIIYADTFLPESTGIFPINLTQSVESDQEIIFTVSCETNVDWKSIEWQPFIFYSAFEDGRNPVRADSSYILSYFPAVDFTMFNLPIKYTTPFQLISKGDSLNTFHIRPFLNFDTSPQELRDLNEGYIAFTAKSRRKVYGRSKFKVTKINNLRFDIEGSENGFEVATMEDDTIYFEYHVSDFYTSQILDADSLGVWLNDTLISNEVGLFSKISPEHIPFGNLYRGWGNFGYNGNRDLANIVIKEERLEIKQPELNEEEVGNIDNTEDIPTEDNQTEASINILFADPASKSWKGYDDLTFVTATTMSSSRLGEDDIRQESSLSDEDNGYKLPIKISKSETNNKSAGASAFFIGYTGTEADGETQTVIDLIDLNVDGYQDIVTEEKILYTLPTGEFERNFTEQVSIRNHVSKNSGIGFSLGATYAGSGSFSSGLPNIKGAGGLGNYIKNADKGADKAGASIGINISGPFNEGDDEAIDSWMDINGDGLIDKVYGNGMVQLNMGYSYLPKEKWTFDVIRKGKSKDFSGGGSLGYNRGNYGFSAGISFSRTDAEVSKTLLDINGDGLVDLVTKDNPLKVRFNTGNSFTNEIDWNGIDEIETNESVGVSQNTAFTASVCIVLPFAAFKISGSPNYSCGNGVSRQHTQITDINGDGFPDFLKSNNDGHLEVKASTIGKTNMLKKVIRPMGSEFTINYQRVGNTYEMPQSKWVMQEVSIFDGLAGDGADTTRMRFEYKNGFQNRHERTFYGFGEVITEELDTENQDSVYRKTVQTFDNTHYYRKGLLLKQQTFDGQGKPFLETENKYVFQDLAGNLLTNFDSIRASIYPALEETTERYYEGQATAGLEQTMQYKYDALGNVTHYYDSGDKTNGDALWADITYHDLDNQYIKASPSNIMVYTDEGLERHRESIIDSIGNVTQIRQFLEINTSANHDMTYDQYGNLESITRPPNDSLERLSFTYTYDDEVQTYVTKVMDSYGYSSKSEYEYAFGQLLKSIDINGQEMIYTIDDRGRIETITGPYEKDSVAYTIAFDYDHTAAVPYARTRHYDPELKGDIVTVTFMDGLQRPVQVKKTGVVSSNDGFSDEPKMIVSGRVKFDAFGRTIETYYPITEDTARWLVFNEVFDDINPTTTQFDILDRPINIFLPDSAMTQTTYAIAPDNNGLIAFQTKIKDAENHIRETFTDIRKRERAKGAHLSGSKIIWTNFDYNPISELMTVKDDGGNETTYDYDQLGRKTSMTHPATGKTAYFYDLANNLTSKITAEISAKIPNGGAIKYKYDFERLVQIDYPRNFQNRVRYHYGDTTATHNRVGRIWLQEDASGGKELFFGKLGEVIKDIRTIIVDPATQLTYVTEYEYDTWNRLQKMIYADGEEVTYDYNAAGKLIAMNGVKNDTTYHYVKQLRYDKFEQRTFLEYGNSTTTHYQYEDDRRRLKHLEVMAAANRQIINNTYEYDKVDNIEMIENNVPIVGGMIGGSCTQNYVYDDLYRLTQANGNFMGNEFGSDYQLTMTYDNLHNISQKTQIHQKDGILSDNLTYDLNYVYQQDRPHIPDNIGSVKYEYDANGNMTKWVDTSGVVREFYFNEDNTLRGVKQKDHLSQYTYDASGERVIKSESSNFEGAFLNGTPAGFIRHDTAYTLYVNPYLVVNNTRFTKHYFIEGQRITSKIGIGSFKNNMIAPNRGITAGNKNFVQRMQNMEREIQNIPASPGHPTINYFNTDPLRSGDPFPIFPSGNYDRPDDRWPQVRIEIDTSTVEPPSHPTIVETKDITNDNVTAGYGYLGHPIIFEGEQFFYHPDHLGSSNYLTDVNGLVRQHTEYTAFGESFVEEKTSSSAQPYKYNGKELDDATGLYYYGARYYDPRISLWQSTDPLMEKYAGWSPYHYTLLNPVKYVDPDGRLIQAAAIPPFILLAEAVKDVLIGLGIIYVGTKGAEKVRDKVYEGYNKANKYDKTQETENIENINSPNKKSSKTSKEKKLKDIQQQKLKNRKEHTNNKSPSKKNKHQKGTGRFLKDAAGEKGDMRRRLPRKRPKNHRGQWSPKNKN